MPTFSLTVSPSEHDDPASVAALAIELARILEAANRSVAPHRGTRAGCITCHGIGCDIGICADCLGSGQRR
jgi:hypothetical protein